MVNFGTESHDDLMDAFTLLTLQIMEYAKTGATPDSLQTERIDIRFSRDWFFRGSILDEKKFNPRTLKNDPYGWD
ncbi:MAG: hypothetical protein COZ34_02070 [Candidatus Pacebacteria bacterium CG_4_10_14_3_um_filter_34_15]|nr:hypothetical protein [Candidatus Pacearchaeota archaeon]NCQ65794.1 hypothetical protein [Candidatus Paceibacterota bacterium]OIO44532.1 MAG: hypothetical protein AUJ41_02720 [Candidatus Pacebacteria bacterium CG1_02_43_31]PIX81669.1 MAG: hypothetical protein COZ34_02070 [Candidatus Pacebacteria bacterium CG_4_10_14_3_um_filter_34_15]PJC43549.1 MAG: hypothetical protein CO039_03480 [Candidatus Pacebacteria bacterium CG_4_9_14_0_2_um_filter_34_50]